MEQARTVVGFSFPLNLPPLLFPLLPLVLLLLETGPFYVSNPGWPQYRSLPALVFQVLSGLPSYLT